VGTAIQQAELYQQAQLELRERQRIETELRRSEGFTRQILESSSDCIKVLDLESRLLYMNPSGQAQMGICDFSQFERRQWVTFWQGEHRIAAQKALTIATSGGTSRFEGFCPTLAGVPKWWEVQISPIRNAAGQVERLLSTSRDITARKASELAIQAGSDRMQLLYETTQALLVSEHPLALIETLFHKLEAMLAFDCCFNYLLDDPQFKPDCTRLRLASSFGIGQELADRWQLLEFGQGICGEVAQLRRQIVEVDIQQSTTPKLAPLRALGMMAYASQPLISQGKLFGTLAFGSRSRPQFNAAETQFLQTLCDQIAIAFDRANLISSLQQQTEQLRQADQLKDEFLAVLSHELRTPLTPILGWSKLLLSQCLNAAEALEAIATIERNAKLQAQLVEDLLDISRIMRGKLSLDAAPVNLAQVLTAALETIDLAAQAKTICLKTTIDPEVPPVWGDRGRLQQVVWNLLSNAVKFTPQGCVEIRLSRLGQQAQIQIRDTGKGIAPDFLPHLFDYFRQEDGTTTRKFGGLGLGLAIAKQIVELHGGTIRAESLGMGQGATFIVELPLSKSHIPAIAPPATLAPLAPLTGLHVLVVDDEDDTRIFIQYFLEENGATVTAVGSALAALQALAPPVPQLEQDYNQNCGWPDLLLSDIGMPDMDGYELIRTIRATAWGRDLPAIALTAYAGELNQQQAIAAGFHSHVAKPIDPPEIIEMLARFLKA
jgi:PAS domain S-box-containing protein